MHVESFFLEQEKRSDKKHKISSQKCNKVASLEMAVKSSFFLAAAAQLARCLDGESREEIFKILKLIILLES